jgi:hypothetical protein
MSSIPANQKLWSMLLVQARAKFRTFPSPAASHWIHEKYTQMGGQFVESKKDLDRDNKKESDKKEQEEKDEKK